MPDWTAFGAVSGLVLFLVLALARATTQTVTGSGGAGDSGGGTEQRGPGDDVGQAPEDLESEPVTESGPVGESEPFGDSEPKPVAEDAEPVAEDTEPVADGPAGASPVGSPAPDEPVPVESDRRTRAPEAGSTRGHGDEGVPVLPSVSTTALLVNVVVTHGVFAAVLLGAAGLTDVPAAAYGVAETAWSTGAPAVVGGLALGGVLAAVNAALASNLDRLGVEHSEALREALAPDGPVGWAVLLVVILPIVAGFEELLFRGILVGAAAVATGISPWLFVVLSSIAFAMGHGLQGRGGLLVTGLLGGVLAAAFVLTNSLLLVIVAHYVVNAVEFVVKEGLGMDVG